VDLTDLAESIGHRFAAISHLDRALRHRAWLAQDGGVESNERLEFLGDAVLGWAIADLAFRRFPDVHEGRLSDLRKSVVNATALARVATELGIGPHISLGRGEAAGGGAEKESILSDAFEAVLAAVYLDAGPDVAYALVERSVAPHLDDAVTLHFDHKTALQELCARRGGAAPVYLLTSTGPDHAKVFAAEVSVGDRVIGTGTGGSKKAAEQVAAAAGCDALS